MSGLSIMTSGGRLRVVISPLRSQFGHQSTPDALPFSVSAGVGQHGFVVEVVRMLDVGMLHTYPE